MTQIYQAILSVENHSKSSNKHVWRDSILFTLLILASLSVRIFILIWTKASFLGKNYLGDMIFYIDMARSFSSGEILQALRLTSQPLYPLLISATAFFTHDFELSARLVSIISGGLLVYPVFRLAEMVYGRYTAILACIIVILAEPLITYSLMGYAESLYLFLITMAIYRAAKFLQTDSKKEIILSGFFFGLAFLTKGQAIVFFATTLAMIAVIQLFKHRKLSLQLVSWLLLFIVSYGIVTSPYTLLLYQKTGRWLLNPKKAATSNSMAGNELNKYMIREDSNGYYTLADILWHEKEIGEVTNAVPQDQEKAQFDAGLYLKIVKDYLVSGLPQFLNNLFPFAFLFFLLALTKFSWNIYLEGYILAIICANIMSASLYWLNPRFLSTLLPMVLIVSSFGVIRAGDLLGSVLARISFIRNQVWHSWKFSPVVLTLIILVIFGEILYLSQIKPDRGFLEDMKFQKEFAQELGKKYGTDYQIMSWGKKGRSAIPYYMGMKQSQVRTIPLASMTKITQYARQEKIKLLVFDAFDLTVDSRIRYPGLNELMINKGQWPGLKIAMYKVSPAKLSNYKSAFVVFEIL